MSSGKGGSMEGKKRKEGRIWPGYISVGFLVFAVACLVFSIFCLVRTNSCEEPYVWIDEIKVYAHTDSACSDVLIGFREVASHFGMLFSILGGIFGAFVKGGGKRKKVRTVLVVLNVLAIVGCAIIYLCACNFEH